MFYIKGSIRLKKIIHRGFWIVFCKQVLHKIKYKDYNNFKKLSPNRTKNYL